MEELIIIANYVLEQTNKTGFKADHYSTSKTDFGMSLYVYARNSNNEVRKYRISNHDCGDYRLGTEICFLKFEDAERYFEPNLFIEKKEVSQYLPMTIESRFIKSDDILLEEKVSKKGNRISIIKRPVYRFYFERI